MLGTVVDTGGRTMANFLKYLSRFLCLLITEHLVTASCNLASFNLACNPITRINYILKCHILVTYINVCVCIFIIPILFKVFVYHLLFKILHSLSLNNDTFPLWRVVFIDSFFSSSHYTWNIQWPPTLPQNQTLRPDLRCPSRSNLILFLWLYLSLPPSYETLVVPHPSLFVLSLCLFIQLVLKID